MKLEIFCENCGAFTDYSDKLINSSKGDFRWDATWKIENISDLEEMDDIQEEDVQVTNIEVTLFCKRCRRPGMTISL
jgi:hypothetical protein